MISSTRKAFYQSCMAKIERFFSTQTSKKKREIIINLLEKNDVRGAVNLAKNDKEYQEILVEEQSHRNPKLAAKFLLEFNLDPLKYSELVRKRTMNTLVFFLHNSPWMQLEEKLYDDKQLLLECANLLLNKGEIDVALSIIKRHNLQIETIHKNSFLNEIIKENSDDNSNQNFQYLENPLFAQDNFCPTEEILGTAPKGEFWSFKDFGIEFGKNAFWIEDCKGDLFEKAKGELLEAKTIGLDTESKSSRTIFEAREVALLQLATEKSAFVFDFKKLWKENDFNELILQILQDEKILKIGFSFKDDVNQMSKGRQIDNRKVFPQEVLNWLDLGQIYHRLIHSELKKNMSLLELCKNVLGKPISKFENVSNWGIRPLRKAQLHYAALDAYILVKIYEKLEKDTNEKVRICL